jgi:hypothetical protein
MVRRDATPTYVPHLLSSALARCMFASLLRMASAMNEKHPSRNARPM